MTLREILAVKGVNVFTIGPEATLREAAQALARHKVGAMLVFEGGQPGPISLLRGIISERDLLRAYGSDQENRDALRVSQWMTAEVITGTPDELVEDVMGLMTRHRIRHLPVVADGQLAGIVSIGDVVKAQHDRLALENRFMKDYIGG